MRKLICKVFQFLLSLATQLIDVVAKTLIAIGTAVVEVLGEVASAVGGMILKSPLGLAVLGVGAYFLFTMLGGDDEKSKTDSNSMPLVEL